MTTWPDAPFTGDPWTQEPTGPDVAYMIRTSRPDGLSFGDFRWPRKGYVAPPFREGCEKNGIYGILEGDGDWSELAPHTQPLFQVVAVLRSECVADPRGDAIRVPRGWVVYSGDVVGALRIIIPVMKRAAGFGAPRDDRPAGDALVSFTGITSDDNSVVTEGLKADAVTSSWRRAAVTTRGGTALATGRQGIAVATSGGTAKAIGSCGLAVSWCDTVIDLQDRVPPAASVAGPGGLGFSAGVWAEASASEGGAIFLAEWHPTDGWLVFAARVGDAGIEPNVSYTLINGLPEPAADWPRHKRTTAQHEFINLRRTGATTAYYRSLPPERWETVPPPFAQAVRALIAREDRTGAAT